MSAYGDIDERAGTAAEQMMDLEERRLEFERGLRFSHIMQMVDQTQGNEALAGIMALADLLVQHGVITEEEFVEHRRRAIEQVNSIGQPKVRLASMGDKYAEPATVEIDCAARLHLCHARCCTFMFYLTYQDLEEGVARWDYGNPYWIKHRDDGYCVHFDPESRGCAIHARRPHVCRLYDCRNDKRIWVDFEARIPAPMEPPPRRIPVAMAEPDLGRVLMAAKEPPDGETE
jgi:Fe-S-cluster containining protein